MILNMCAVSIVCYNSSHIFIRERLKITKQKKLDSIAAKATCATTCKIYCIKLPLPAEIIKFQLFVNLSETRNAGCLVQSYRQGVVAALGINLNAWPWGPDDLQQVQDENKYKRWKDVITVKIRVLSSTLCRNNHLSLISQKANDLFNRKLWLFSVFENMVVTCRHINIYTLNVCFETLQFVLNWCIFVPCRLYVLRQYLKQSFDVRNCSQTQFSIWAYKPNVRILGFLSNLKCYTYFHNNV